MADSKVNPFVALIPAGITLYVGFNGALALFPRGWTHDYDGITVFGQAVGIAGAVIFGGLVLAGVQRIFGTGGPDGGSNEG